MAFTWSRNDWGRSASQEANAFSLPPSTMSSRRAGLSCFLGVRSTTTVTYLFVAGVAPYVLVHADRVDPVEPRRIIDQRFQAFLQYGRVERVPRAGQVARARQDALRLQHDLGRGPPYRRLGQTPALRGDARQVVLPRACARQALIAAHAHQQVHGVLADRRVREPAAPRGTHAAGRAALRAVAGRVRSSGSRPIGHTPAREPFRSCRCQTGTSPSLSRPSNTRASNAPDSLPSRAVFFIFSITH